MIRLALLLLGPEFVRERWRMLAAIGALWTLVGIFLVWDAFEGAVGFPYHLLGYVMILEALVTLVATTSNLGTQTVLRKGRAIAFFIIGLLIIDTRVASGVIVAFIFGLLFVIDGGFRLSAAWVVRFPGWRIAIGLGIFELVSAVLVFLPHPLVYVATLPYCIGAGMILSGIGSFTVALRARRLPTGSILSLLFARGKLDPAEMVMPARELRRARVSVQEAPLLLHVWTPAGSAKDVLPQPLVDRYMAAVDAMGVISTGHAALELPPDLYVSHYPDAEIDHSPDDFRAILRATTENDVAGKFQPSYAIESAQWCPATAQVEFVRYDAERLRAFWRVYSKDTTYNLTNRNCSSTVASALEASLEGSLGRNGPTLGAFLSSLCNPELWVAAQLREHAHSMAWTPGLVLDYARALRVAIDPPPLGLVTFVTMIGNALRGLKSRREFIAGVRARAAAARNAALAKAATQ